jgi:Flp pilus assembly protein CpaB
VRSVRLPLWARSRLLARARLVLAALLLALAGLTATSGAGPVAVEAGSVEVLVASRDLPGGAVLAAADVRLVALPAAAVPAGALPAGETVAGRVLAGAVRRGEPLTDARVVSAGLVRLAGGPGAAAVPVRLADPGVAALLRPGDRIDVIVVAGSGQTSVVVAGVPVLTVPQAPDTGPAEGALVVLAVPEYLAPRLVAAALNARLAITLRPP